MYSEMRKVSGGVEYKCDLSVQGESSSGTVIPSHVPMSASKMETLPPLEEDTDAIVLGTDISTGLPKGFDLSHGSRIFVGTKGEAGVVSRITNRYVLNGGKRVCLITSKDTDDFDYAVEVIEDIDEFVSEFVTWDAQERLNTLLVIDGFCDFYDRISDEALLVFEKALKTNPEMNIITFDAMQRIQDYRDTGLYVYLVRARCGAMIGGYIDDAVASAITTEIYEVPKKFREKSLNQAQAIIYRGKEMAYIDIERG